MHSGSFFEGIPAVLQREGNTSPGELRSTDACDRLDDRRRILLVLNADTQAYLGELTADTAKAWQILHPAAGAVRPAEKSDGIRIRLALEPSRAVLLIEE